MKKLATFAGGCFWCMVKPFDEYDGVESVISGYTGGYTKNPTYEDYEEFLKSRCFPETRDKMKIQLEALGLPFYDPMLIIEKTQGRMAEDDFWILIERVNNG